MQVVALLAENLRGAGAEALLAGDAAAGASTQAAAGVPSGAPGDPSNSAFNQQLVQGGPGWRPRPVHAATPANSMHTQATGAAPDWGRSDSTSDVTSSIVTAPADAVRSLSMVASTVGGAPRPLHACPLEPAPWNSRVICSRVGSVASEIGS